MSGELAIRPITLDDADGVYRLRRQPSVLANTLSIPSIRPEAVRRRLEGYGPDDHVFVAVLDGEVVGMAGLHVGTGKLRLGGSIGMMVHDEHQGRGIGRRLLDALLDVADNYLGLARVELEVLADNARAIRLYERSGFEHEGRKRRAVLRYGDFQDILVMGRLRATPGDG